MLGDNLQPLPRSCPVMRLGPAVVYRFADFELEIEELPGEHARRALRYQNEDVTIERQTLHLLALIVARRRAVLSRQDIERGLWGGAPGQVGIEHRIDSAVNKLRRALEKCCDGAGAYIVTERGIGFRLEPPVEVLTPEPGLSPPVASSGREEAIATAPGNREPAVVADHQLPAARAAVLGVSTVFGLMVGLALLVEVAYEWPSYRSWVLPTALLAALASGGTAFAVFGQIRRRAQAGSTNTLAWGAGVLFAASTVIALAIAPALPDVPLVAARIQTMTARVGWVKSVGEALFLPMLALVPLHTAFVLGQRVQEGGSQMVRDLLLSEPGGVAPVGVLYVTPRFAWTVYLIVTGAWLVANARLFESLETRPYSGLFEALVFTRVALGLLMLLCVLLWYVVALNDLKRRVIGAPTRAVPL
jgi:DNA-binding winged helix-turn-helix (wHTH) protein